FGHGQVIRIVGVTVDKYIGAHTVGYWSEDGRKKIRIARVVNVRRHLQQAMDALRIEVGWINGNVHDPEGRISKLRAEQDLRDVGEKGFRFPRGEIHGARWEIRRARHEVIIV